MNKKSEKYVELVEELVKNQPNQKKIKDLMELNGLTYSKDPITQMSLVLDAINAEPNQNSISAKNAEQL